MRYKKTHLAGCVILNNKGEILLLHRNTSIRKQWETPGGKLEKGENHRIAAKREIKEEIGTKIDIIKKLGKKDFIENEYLMTYTWYLAKIISGKLNIMEKDKFDEMKYFNWNELKKIKHKLSLNTKNLLEAYLAGEIKI